jgi:hypothetical protein
MTLFSLEASLNYANHTPQQENDLAKKMRDTSGRRCLERFGRFNHVGLWAKTFSDLLIGMEGWYSTRCKLTWKLKGTKYNRMYFQLYPSTLHTEETESGLLPTPNTSDSNNANNKDNHDVERGYLRGYASMGLLPTPTTQEPTSECEINENGRRVTTNGKDSHSMNIGRMAAMGMLPTPAAVDYKQTTLCESQRDRSTLPGLMVKMMLPTPTAYDWKDRGEQTNWKGDDLVSTMHKATSQTGKTSQLSPQFVLEMMGFPTDWTLLPFLNGEMSPSKQEEMP